MFIFQFLTDKMHNSVEPNIIVHFIIQKLKNTHTFLKNIQSEKAEEPLILTERERQKPDISHLGWVRLLRFQNTKC